MRQHESTYVRTLYMYECHARSMAAPPTVQYLRDAPSSASRPTYASYSAARALAIAPTPNHLAVLRTRQARAPAADLVFVADLYELSMGWFGSPRLVDEVGCPRKLCSCDTRTVRRCSNQDRDCLS